jgi:lipoprotein-anchoring transpeptidase ErfK/SrfK
MRIGAAALSLAFAGILSVIAAGTKAQTSAQGTRIAQASQPNLDEPFTRPVRRPPRRVRIYAPSHFEPDVYPRYFPGSNAVRVCNATYVQEFRPSGTVIVPRMTCVWRGG